MSPRRPAKHPGVKVTPGKFPTLRKRYGKRAPKRVQDMLDAGAFLFVEPAGKAAKYNAGGWRGSSPNYETPCKSLADIEKYMSAEPEARLCIVPGTVGVVILDVDGRGGYARLVENHPTVADIHEDLDRDRGHAAYTHPHGRCSVPRSPISSILGNPNKEPAPADSDVAPLVVDIRADMGYCVIHDGADLAKWHEIATCAETRDFAAPTWAIDKARATAADYHAPKSSNGKRTRTTTSGGGVRTWSGRGKGLMGDPPAKPLTPAQKEAVKAYYADVYMPACRDTTTGGSVGAPAKRLAMLCRRWGAFDGDADKALDAMEAQLTDPQHVDQLHRGWQAGWDTPRSQCKPPRTGEGNTHTDPGPRPEPPFGLADIEERLSRDTTGVDDLDNTARRLVGWIDWAKRRKLDWFAPKGNTDDPTPAPLRARIAVAYNVVERNARAKWATLLAKHRFDPITPPKKRRRQWREYEAALVEWERADKARQAARSQQRLEDAQASYDTATMPGEFEPRARPAAPKKIITLPPVRSMANAQACMAHLGYEFRLNARSQRPQVRDARKHSGGGVFEGWFDMSDPVRDRIIDDIALFVLEGDEDDATPMRWSVEAFRRALSAWSADAIDPFRSYLLGLERDPAGKRIDDVLHEVFGADKDCPLTRWASRALFMVPVQRCIEIPDEANTGPGAHVKVMPILNGPQGIGKSPFLKHLLPPDARETLFSDAFDFAANAQRQLECQLGRVIVECGELSGFYGAALAAMKVAISKTDLSGVRMAFKELVVDFPRRDFIVGTSDAPTEFLPADVAGNTRFVVAELKHGSNVEAYLAEHRDQLWADAVHQYRTEGVRAPLPRTLEPLQAARNELHRWRDPMLEERLHELADTWPGGRLTLRYIAEETRISGRWQIPPSDKDEGPRAMPAEDAPNKIEIWIPTDPDKARTNRLRDALRLTGWTEKRAPDRPRVTDPDGKISRPRTWWEPPTPTESGA